LRGGAKVGILNRLFRKKQPGRLARREISGQKTQTAHYSFVEEQNGNIRGIWFQNPNDALHKDRLHQMLVASRSLPNKNEVFFSIFPGDYRVVPNTFNDQGGRFFMLGSTPAPGETVPSLTDFAYRKAENLRPA